VSLKVRRVQFTFLTCAARVQLVVAMSPLSVWLQVLYRLSQLLPLPSATGTCYCEGGATRGLGASVRLEA
jgi:hypothetical protein